MEHDTTNAVTNISPIPQKSRKDKKNIEQRIKHGMLFSFMLYLHNTRTNALIWNTGGLHLFILPLIVKLINYSDGIKRGVYYVRTIFKSINYVAF